jgi:hypothetical protein
MTAKPDIITSEQHGLWSFRGASRRGKAWLRRNVPDTEYDIVAAEHPYGMDIACVALRDGLRLQDAATGRFASLPEG